MLTCRRKHTGERPFQCHCARRFSRLDNLRQHAQTVHVNEDIPGDSLAATGTRFQRQIRTDRVRPTGSRSRASTAGSQGPHGRGHARNLSTSSIASTVSTMSTMSNMSSMSRDTSQRRPNSLIVGDQQSPRARLTIDTMRASPQNSYNNANNSPGEANTPTSTNYANTPSSPFSSTLGSPVSFSRNLGPWGDKTPNRRLSVPSGANPFQLSPGSHGPPYLKPLAPSVASQNSSNSSLVTSPTSSIHSFSRDFNPADPDPRRRTWHPSTYTNYNYQRPATSGLTFYQTPDAPRPAFAPQAVAAAGQSQRLPGFETFDQISQRPTTPSRQSSHSTQAETPGRPLLFSASSDRSIPGPNDRRGHASWDMSLHQNLTKLDIANGTPPKEQSSHWGKQGTTEIQNAASNNSQPFQFPPGIAQSSSQAPGIAHSSSQAPGIAISSHEPQKRPSGSDHYPPAPPTTSQRSKREGWYQGPITVPQAMRAQRPSPEDSSSSDGAPTPSTASLDYQPSIVHPNGYVESQPAVPKASVPVSAKQEMTITSLDIICDLTRSRISLIRCNITILTRSPIKRLVRCSFQSRNSLDWMRLLPLPRARVRTKA